MNEPTSPNQIVPVTRRGFLKTSSTAVLGGALLGGLTLDRSAFAAGDDLLKIALIGCGGRGSGAADQALSTAGNVRLVALGDAFKDRLESSYRNLKEKHGAKVQVAEDNKFTGFDAYKQAIALADVVILATPPGFRPIHFEEAIKQGKHVFMEKPVAVDGPGVRKVLAAAEEAKKKNLKVGVGLQRRHHEGYIETIKRLRDGAIGDIVSARAYWNDGGVWVKPRLAGQSEMDYQMRNWYYFNWLCGDHINEQHIHNLDVINWIKDGYPVKARGFGGRQVRNGKDYGEIYDHHAVEYEYADSTRMASQCRHIRDCWNAVSEAAVGTNGTWFSDSSNFIMKSHKGGTLWRYKSQGKNPYQVEHDDLFDAIRNNKEYNEAFNGAKSTMTAIMGRMATYSGQEIEWDKALNSSLDLSPKGYAWDAAPVSAPDANGFYPIAVPGVYKPYEA